MDMENIPVKFWKDPNIQESANKVSWPWPSLKGHRKVDIKIIRDIDVVNTSAEFWMDPSIPEIVIVLTNKVVLPGANIKVHKGHKRLILN